MEKFLLNIAMFYAIIKKKMGNFFMAETLEFSKEYSSAFKQKFHDNAGKLFDSWVTQSGINPEKNRETAKEYREVKAQFEDLEKNIAKQKRIRNVMIFFAVVGFLAFAVSVYLLVMTLLKGSYSTAAIVVPSVLFPLGLTSGISLIIAIVKKINPKINNTVSLRNETEKKMKTLLSTCYKQLAPLYKMYRDSATADLVQKTVPIIKLDSDFDMRRLDLLKNKYGFSENLKENESTIGVFSGEILGNPFVEERRLSQTWGNETYYGELYITWTESYTDSEGNRHTVQRSQTLHASVIKPKPFYHRYTRLIYGNEAAPNLTFSRSSRHTERMSDKEREKYVAKYEKKLTKLENKALKTGDTFTSMGNVEFEALFNAIDRDNEIEFRLLFTPLAQKNMLNLLKTPYPFGDDFDFVKIKTLNYIASEHAQKWNFDVNSNDFRIYDVDLCKDAFVKYNDNYFLNLYFELAPLMSIPLYQQQKPREFIYKSNYERNYTSFESDVLANALDVSLLRDPDTITETILKTSLVEKNEKQDTILVTGHSFFGVNQVDYVSVLGGDGRFHDVPVPWVEYCPTSKTSTATVIKNESDRNNVWNKSNAILHNLRIDLKQ